MSYIIRQLKLSEYSLLDDFLYEAIFQQDESSLLPRSIIEQPELKIFTENFGKDDDYCLVAEIDGIVIGAVWVRILSGAVKGFGNIDDKTPECAISLYKNYRKKDIGTALMAAMLIFFEE